MLLSSSGRIYGHTGRHALDLTCVLVGRKNDREPILDSIISYYKKLNKHRTDIEIVVYGVLVWYWSIIAVIVDLISSKRGEGLLRFIFNRINDCIYKSQL